MMEAVELAVQLERVFGYPLQDKEEIVERFGEYLELSYDEEPEEILAEFLIENVHWAGERQEGVAPFDEEQPAEVLARHLTGLFAFDSGFSFCNTGKSAEMGSWLADLNPRDDKLVCPVYYQSRTQTPRRAIFESPRRLAASENLFREVRNTYEESPQTHKRLVDEMLESYPQVCPLFADWFGRFGVNALNPNRSFPDVGGERLFSIYDAFLPIANVLIERSRGNNQAKLDTCDVRKIEEMNIERSNYPPHLLLTLLGAALDDDFKTACGAAERIRRDHLGVDLTQRWARRVISHEPPFSSEYL
jgi:hypothetical protein